MAFPKTLSITTRGYWVSEEPTDNNSLAVATRGYWPDQGASAEEGEIQFATDIGLDRIGRFDPNRNPFVLTALVSELVATTEAEGDATVKSPARFRLTIGATVYDVPPSLWRRIRPGHRGRVYWQSGTSAGVFRFFRSPPPVF